MKEIFADPSGNKATTNLSSHQPVSKEGYQKRIDYRREHETGSILYVLPPHLGTNEPEYQYYIASTAQLPIQVTWKYDGYESVPACGHTQLSDLMIWRLDQFYKMFPEIKSVMYSVITGGPANNMIIPFTSEKTRDISTVKKYR